MKQLPAGLADPLHLSYPIPWKLLFGLALLLLAGILFALFRAWLRRPRPPKPSQAPVTALPRPSGIADAIARLRQRHRDAVAFRSACHELSTLVRRYFESSTGRGYSTLTAGEIRREVGETPGSRFFSFLADIQFGRGAPTRNDFEGACDLALDVTRQETR